MTIIVDRLSIRLPPAIEKYHKWWYDTGVWVR